MSECEHPLLTESNWCPECGYIMEDEDECEHPNLQESCRDGSDTDWQGSTWYCIDCGEYIHGKELAG